MHLRCIAIYTGQSDGSKRLDASALMPKDAQRRPNQTCPLAAALRSFVAEVEEFTRRILPYLPLECRAQYAPLLIDITSPGQPRHPLLKSRASTTTKLAPVGRQAGTAPTAAAIDLHGCRMSKPCNRAPWPLNRRCGALAHRALAATRLPPAARAATPEAASHGRRGGARPRKKAAVSRDVLPPPPRRPAPGSMPPSPRARCVPHGGACTASSPAAPAPAQATAAARPRSIAPPA